MKFTCLQENLLKGLQIVNRAIPTKASLPILSNFLISTENGRIRLAATNLGTTIVSYIGASVEEEGEITVPAKLFKDYVTNLKPGNIDINLKNNVLNIKSEKAKTKINGSSAQDYPKLPEFKEETEFLELNPTDFNLIMSITAFCAATDDLKPVFTGVLMKYKDNKLTIASTDGFRLSEKKLDLKSDIEDFDVIIPAKTLLEVARIFNNSEVPLQFSIQADENQATFRAEDTIISTRVLNGQYPDYERIIPTEKIVETNFKSEDLLEAVKLTSIFAKDANNKDEPSTIKITLDPEEGQIKLTSLRKQSGEHESSFSAAIEGKSMEIAFNARYLLDFLNNIKTESFTLTTNGNLTPCKLIPEGIQDFLHILMPMQI